MAAQSLHSLYTHNDMTLGAVVTSRNMGNTENSNGDYCHGNYHDYCVTKDVTSSDPKVILFQVHVLSDDTITESMSYREH